MYLFSRYTLTDSCPYAVLPNESATFSVYFVGTVGATTRDTPLVIAIFPGVKTPSPFSKIAVSVTLEPIATSGELEVKLVIHGSVIVATVTLQVAVLAPSAVVAVITAVPTATGETSPEELTLAMALLLEVQDTLVFVALAGVMVATKGPAAPPAVRFMEVVFRLTPVTGTEAAETITLQVPVLAPSAVVAVITAAPTATGETRPEELTLAMALLLEVQDTLVFVALAGVMVATKEPVAPPVVRFMDVVLRLTPVTRTGAAETITGVPVEPPVAVEPPTPTEPPVSEVVPPVATEPPVPTAPPVAPTRSSEEGRSSAECVMRILIRESRKNLLFTK